MVTMYRRGVASDVLAYVSLELVHGADLMSFICQSQVQENMNWLTNKFNFMITDYLLEFYSSRLVSSVPEDGGSTFRRNVCNYLSGYPALTLLKTAFFTVTTEKIGSYGKSSDLCWNAWLESCSEHQISWLRVFVVSSGPPGKHRNSTLN
jgi:hypothetical protein